MCEYNTKRYTTRGIAVYAKNTNHNNRCTLDFSVGMGFTSKIQITTAERGATIGVCMTVYKRGAQ